MKSLITTLFICCACLCISNLVTAQSMVTTQPRVSQEALSIQKIGLTQVKVIYHRPAVKGRALLGNLIPEGQVWRAGANENTVIYFSDDVMIEGQSIAAGKYGLHMLPEADAWTVIFSKNHSAWGSFSYKQADDALRVKVKATTGNPFTEFLSFGFNNIRVDGATCVLSWGDLQVPFDITADVHEVVLANLRKELQTQAGWTWRGWNEAANYCLQNKVNTQEAIQWANRSVFTQANTQNMLTKAKLIALSKGDAEKENEYILAALNNDLSNHNVTWKEYLGAAQYLIGQKYEMDQAMTWLDQSIAMNGNMTNMMAKSTLLENMGKTKEAKSYKTNALAKGTNAELNNYGYQLLLGGKPAEAVAVFEANAKNNPNDPNVWDSLGEGYLNNGQKEKAIESLKKALSLNPPDAVKANTLKSLKKLGVGDEGIKP